MKKSIAVVDCRISKACEISLMREGFDVLKLPKSDTLPSAIASHTDMLLFRYQNHIVSTADFCEANENLFKSLLYLRNDIKWHFTADKTEPKHPHDAKMNAIYFGNKLFCKQQYVSEYIKELMSSLGFQIINVNQGYPACTVLKLSDTLAITADIGMKRTLEKNGIEVHLIENGEILLPPYEYGFIGGCAGIHCGKLYFLGNPMLHPSFDIINFAAAKAGLEIVSLSDERLCDLGGILFL